MKTDLSRSTGVLQGLFAGSAWSHAILLLIPLLAVVLVEPLPESMTWRHVPFHAFVETFGAVVAIGTAFVILLYAPKDHFADIPPGIALGFLAMGVLDGFHAAVELKQGFVWLHSMATFFGGILFASILVPTHRYLEDNPVRATSIVLLFCLTFGAASILLPGYLPSMEDAQGFTGNAVYLNVVGGIGFIAAALKLNAEYLRSRQIYLKTLAVLSVLFGAAGIVFEFSNVWDVTWWSWHLLRIGAYLLVIYFIFNELRRAAESIGLAKERLDLATDAAAIGVPNKYPAR